MIYFTNPSPLSHALLPACEGFSELLFHYCASHLKFYQLLASAFDSSSEFAGAFDPASPLLAFVAADFVADSADFAVDFVFGGRAIFSSL